MNKQYQLDKTCVNMDGYTRKTEYLQFLLDQKGERKMFMGNRDPSYEERVNSSILKKKKKLEMGEEIRKSHSLHP